MRENYVTNPRMNKELDDKAKQILSSREIYYVIPFNAFMSVKNTVNGRKVYSGFANFLSDACTNILNMHVSDKFISENCIHIKDLETLDKYAFQKDLSIPSMGVSHGCYSVHGEDREDPKSSWARYILLSNGCYKMYPNDLTRLPDDPRDDSLDDLLDMDDLADY